MPTWQKDSTMKLFVPVYFTDGGIELKEFPENEQEVNVACILLRRIVAAFWENAQWSNIDDDTRKVKKHPEFAVMVFL